MASKKSRKVFVNLAVRDLKKSMAFFKELGFEFNAQFTDEKAACMVLSEDGYVMLLAEPFFKTFTKSQICDTKTHTETMLALSCESREEVVELVRIALAAGARRVMDPVDHGFMYSESFYDLDGHHWEPVWMDPKAIQS